MISRWNMKSTVIILTNLGPKLSIAYPTSKNSTSNLISAIYHWYRISSLKLRNGKWKNGLLLTGRLLNNMTIYSKYSHKLTLGRLAVLWLRGWASCSSFCFLRALRCGLRARQQSGVGRLFRWKNICSLLWRLIKVTQQSIPLFRGLLLRLWHSLYTLAPSTGLTHYVKNSRVLTSHPAAATLRCVVSPFYDLLKYCIWYIHVLLW